MDTTALADEIKTIRERLAGIEEDRKSLADDAFEEKAILRDEEHRLTARLAELSDAAAEAGAGLAERKAAAQTDLERAPQLPEV